MNPLLAPPYDVEAEIRRTLPGQRRHLARLQASTRDLRRFARLEGVRLQTDLAPRLASFAVGLLGSPHYVVRLRAEGLSPRDLRTPADLAAFPLLGREVLRERQDLLASFGGSRGGLFFDRSTGSTGLPIRVLKDGYDSVHPWAVLRFWMEQLGVRAPRRPRVALVCALPHGVEYAVAPPALSGGVLRRISLARPEPLRRLLEFDPHVLFTDPAGLHWLMAQSRMPSPRIVLSSGQHLATPLREEARARLRAPVVNYYSTTETGPVAWECLPRPGRFHVLHPDVWVESVAGELVVTRLRPSVLPLLRYRTGDGGTVETEVCPCGYGGRSIVGLEGRRACAFVTPDGRRVDAWQLAWLFKHEPLSAFRLTQTGPSDFQLEFHPRRRAEGLADRLADSPPGRHRPDAPRLRAALATLGWPKARLTVRATGPEDEAVKPEPFRRCWVP